MKKIAALAIILILLLITLFFSLELKNLKISGDFTALFPWSEITDHYLGGVGGQKAILAKEVDNSPKKNYRLISNDYKTSLKASNSSEIEKDEVYTSTMFVLVYSDEIYTPSFLDELDRCIDEIDDRRDSARPTSVLDWFTLTGEGDYLLVESMDANTSGPWTEEEALELERRIENDPIVPYYLVGGSRHSFLLQFVYNDKASESQLDELSAIFDPLRAMGARVVMMSNMVISAEVIKALKHDLYALLSIALLLMIVVYYLSFRSLRAVVIPFLLSIMSFIWTLGMMALLSIELNLLSILTPFLVLILGSTYSMHMLNEYYLGQRGIGEYNPIVSSKHIIKTILLGCITTIFGFLSLSFAPSHTLFNFGISVSFGVFFSAFLAIFGLPSLLILLPQPKERTVRKLREGRGQKLINWWAEKSVKIWPISILVFILIFAIFLLVKDRISVDSNYMSYFSEDDEFGKDCLFFSRELGGTTPFTVTITAPEGEENFFLDTDNLRKVREWEEKVALSKHVLQIISFPRYVAFLNRELQGVDEIPYDEGIMSILRMVFLSYSEEFPQMSQIISSDFNRLTITVQTWDGDIENLITTTSVAEVYQDMVSAFSLLPSGTKVSVSGYPVISEKFSSRLLSDQKISTSLALVSIFLIATLFLSSFKKGLLVLVPVTLGIMVNYIFMYILSIPFDIITISFSSIAIGCGVDDALHFSLRFKEIERREKDKKKVVVETIKNTARPIILTTLSIVSGMLILVFATYVPIKYFGYLMSITLMASMVSTLVFLPQFALLFDYIDSLFDGRAYLRSDKKNGRVN